MNLREEKITYIYVFHLFERVKIVKKKKKKIERSSN